LKHGPADKVALYSDFNDGGQNHAADAFLAKQDHAQAVNTDAGSWATPVRSVCIFNTRAKIMRRKWQSKASRTG
jgi:hypothetical protein